jgi:hypothetical protein
MSNFLAIATVTAALSLFLSEALSEAGVDLGGVSATSLRPDAGSGLPAPGVNVFLYQVTPNAAWQNVDLPTRRANGELIQRSQAALDLHYLLTCYGDDAKLEPQRVLGVVVRALHTQPILTRDLIRKSVLDDKFKNLIPQSNLADAVELVKFTPLSLSLEELSKLWSVYFQTHYSLSVAYQASVILIESEDSTHAALPVRARNIYVVPFRQPLVEEVKSKVGANQPIVFTSTIVVTGKRLRADVTKIMVGGVDATSKIQTASDTEISLTLPAGLRAGVQGLQVIQPRLMGTPPTQHPGVESNLAAFVLSPRINKNPEPDGPPDITVALPNVTVKLTPPVAKKQRATLLLNQLNSPNPRAYSFDAAPHNRPADPAETDTLVFPIAGVAAGDYLVRVQVDGADSPLERDPNESDPNYDPKYIGPKVTIP